MDSGGGFHFIIRLVSLSLLLNRFSLHSRIETFLISTVLASITLPLVHNTIPLITADVGEIFSYGSLEESLTAFAAINIEL